MFALFLVLFLGRQTRKMSQRWWKNDNSGSTFLGGICVSMSAGVKAGLWTVSNCNDQRRIICTLSREGATPPPPPPTTSAPLSCPSDGWKV